MVKQGEQKRVQDRVVVTERDQAGSLGKLADAVRGQNTGKLVQKPEQPAEEQTEVTEQLLFAGQGKTPLLSGCKKQHGQFTESEEYKIQTDNRSRQECKSEYAAVKAAGQFSVLCCCIK